MKEKRDKLGRRIPVFDRSAATKAAVKTTKERHGDDFYRRAGSLGDHSRNRGYFGKLKDEGRVKELKEITRKGSEKSNFIQKVRREIRRENSALPRKRK